MALSNCGPHLFCSVQRPVEHSCASGRALALQLDLDGVKRVPHYQLSHASDRAGRQVNRRSLRARGSCCCLTLLLPAPCGRLLLHHRVRHGSTTTATTTSKSNQ